MVVDKLMDKLWFIYFGIFVLASTLDIDGLNKQMPTTQEKLIIAAMSNGINGSIIKQIMPAKPIAESVSYFRLKSGAISRTKDIIEALITDVAKLQMYI